MEIEVLGSIEWPSEIETKQFECAGAAFCSYYTNCFLGKEHNEYHQGNDNSVSIKGDDSEQNDSGLDDTNHSGINLLEESDLSELNYYDVLNIRMGDARDKDLLKKAYRKACLKYHPDKTGRTSNDDDEDEIFILIKQAYDTLRVDDKRRAYDSSLSFDESIPNKYTKFSSSDEFYKTYRPVFQRNLRFSISKGSDPPKFGDDTSPIQQVNEFYDWWIKFESWRDFSLKAAEELKYDLETAGDRYEKRYMEKEIEKKSKIMKKEEMNRITSLVENAMAADPRLKKHKEDVARARKKAKEEKERAKAEREKAAEKIRLEEERKLKLEEEAEKVKLAQAKAKREQEKKTLRKSKQLFRKLSLQAYSNDKSGSWNSMEEAHNDIEFLCEKLTILEIDEMNKFLGNKGGSLTAENAEAVKLIKNKVTSSRLKTLTEKKDVLEDREMARQKAKEIENKTKAKYSAAPWSPEEISALAKAVKKYPAGGANRWETIAQFINNLLKLKQPRTKEECISQYHLASTQIPTNSVSKTNEEKKLVWTDEEDKLLQQGLAKFPPSMEKNERWSSIAKMVPGKTKKQCVQRFKAIREALKKKK